MEGESSYAPCFIFANVTWHSSHLEWIWNNITTMKLFVILFIEEDLFYRTTGPDNSSHASDNYWYFCSRRFKHWVILNSPWSITNYSKSKTPCCCLPDFIVEPQAVCSLSQEQLFSPKLHYMFFYDTINISCG